MNEASRATASAVQELVGAEVSAVGIDGLARSVDLSGAVAGWGLVDSLAVAQRGIDAACAGTAVWGYVVPSCVSPRLRLVAVLSRAPREGAR